MQSIEVMFLPHPPIAVPQLQRGQGFRIADTLEGFEAVGKKISQIKPETIIYITPHGNSFSNGLCLLYESEIEGDLSHFGHEEVRVTKRINKPLSVMINNELDDYDILSILLDDKTARGYRVPLTLDHGTLVPMRFVDEFYSDYDIVHITTSGQSLLDHYRTGVLIQKVLKDYDGVVAVVCSGDLSHALKDEGPYDYHPYGAVFDQLVIEAIKEKDPRKLIALDHKQERDAAQCGLKSFLVGFGLMDGHDYHSEIFSYEGPFGVGYLTGYLANDFLSLKSSLLESLELEAFKLKEEKRDKEDGYVKLARKSIENYVRNYSELVVKEKPDFLTEEEYIDLTQTQAGAFVSIHKDGLLRGCIGTTEPSAPSLLKEIVYCAISACSSDPRFNPVQLEELDSLDVKVDRLYPPQRIYDLDELDVKRYGVIVEKGKKRGLLLPNLEGVTTIEQQISIAKQKAGIKDDDLIYYRFEVERHGSD